MIVFLELQKIIPHHRSKWPVPKNVGGILAEPWSRNEALIGEKVSKVLIFFCSAAKLAALRALLICVGAVRSRARMLWSGYTGVHTVVYIRTATTAVILKVHSLCSLLAWLGDWTGRP